MRVAMSTGNETIDRALIGWGWGNYCVVAAVDGTCKTNFLLRSALESARRGVCVAVVTLDHSTSQIQDHLLGLELEMHHGAVRSYDESGLDPARVMCAKRALENLKITRWLSRAANIDELTERVRSAVGEGAQLIFIDGLDRLVPNETCREDAIGDVGASIKDLSKDLGVTIVHGCYLDARPNTQACRDIGDHDQLLWHADRLLVLDSSFEGEDSRDALMSIVVTSDKHGPGGVSTRVEARRDCAGTVSLLC